MEYLIRLVQVHETFRKPELQALAILEHIDLEFLFYSEYSPYCIVRLPSDDAACTLIRRSILAQNVYALYAHALDFTTLHSLLQDRPTSQWAAYTNTSFKFSFDTYQNRLSAAQQRDLIESFSYLGFRGPIKMHDPEVEFCVFLEHEFKAVKPRHVFFGRWIAGGGREAVNTYSLKKRKYISTTSMDAELALITANLTLASPNGIFYDPFLGTGSFPIACAHFGALVLGSDIDGRSIRGKEGKNVVGNFTQYGLGEMWLGGFIADLTHTPVREDRRWANGILCDPPYGVREGLRVLGTRDGSGKQIIWVDGIEAHLHDTYIPPKRPYGFEAMLGNILTFSAKVLVDDGRLSLWMPTANDEEVEMEIPTHPCLEVVSVCVQAFRKWSRRLLTYRRLSNIEVVDIESRSLRDKMVNGVNANDLNPFRKKYFEGFKRPDGGEDLPHKR